MVNLIVIILVDDHMNFSCINNYRNSCSFLSHGSLLDTMFLCLYIQTISTNHSQDDASKIKTSFLCACLSFLLRSSPKYWKLFYPII